MEILLTAVVNTLKELQFRNHVRVITSLQRIVCENEYTFKAINIKENNEAACL